MSYCGGGYRCRDDIDAVCVAHPRMVVAEHTEVEGHMRKKKQGVLWWHVHLSNAILLPIGIVGVLFHIFALFGATILYWSGGSYWLVCLVMVDFLAYSALALYSYESTTELVEHLQRKK